MDASGVEPETSSRLDSYTKPTLKMRDNQLHHAPRSDIHVPLQWTFISLSCICDKIFKIQENRLWSIIIPTASLNYKLNSLNNSGCFKFAINKLHTVGPKTLIYKSLLHIYRWAQFLVCIALAIYFILHTYMVNCSK